MQATQGSLVLIGLNTPTPQVFWNGVLVQGVQRIRTEWEADESRVKLIVDGDDDATYLAMADAGIIVKKVGA